MDRTKVNLKTEIDDLKEELEAYKSYHAERTATELALILFGFVCGISVGYIIGSP
jgi:F0F1-type ATP synthase assembly protein I